MIHSGLALQGRVGDWIFYVVPMKYGEVARQVNFAYELGSNKELGQLIQLGISNRTTDITQYLLTSQHRFLGGLVVAAWGGEPQYAALAMDDPEGMLQGLDQGFGVLTFDGTQAYFVLDGQHRLRAIKDAILKNPELAREDICVLIVTHYNSPEGRTRPRRLFSNINKNAKHTGAAENVALDEDDAFAILTRRMVEEHPFLKQDGRVRVILSVTEEGGLKLAAGNVPQTDPKAFTTLTVLFDLLQLLGYDLPASVRTKTVRPSDEILESAYQTLSGRLDDLLGQCGDVRARLEAAASAREVRAPKNAVGDGHPFMRPVVQKAVARVASEIMQQGSLSWDELTERLSQLPWKMSSAPWTAVFSGGEDGDGGKMLGGKENTVLLDELLHIHLAPPSKQRVMAIRKKFKSIRGTVYPVSEEELFARVPTGEIAPPSLPIVLPTEISDGPEIVLLDESLSEADALD